MKLSIVISIYNSHGILARQIRHFSKMNLPDDVEFIFIDDGSDPPLTGEMKNLTFYQTNNKLAWTQGLGRNLGVSKAKGEYLLMTDIDHILSRDLIMAARDFTGNRMAFRRKIGVLLEDGTFTQDREILKEYGYDNPSLEQCSHGNTFAMKKSIFDELGGYSEKYCTWGYHPASKQGDDVNFNHRWNRAHRGINKPVGPDVYVFPTGKFHKNKDMNPMGLFHNLSQKKQTKFFKHE